MLRQVCVEEGIHAVDSPAERYVMLRIAAPRMLDIPYILHSCGRYISRAEEMILPIPRVHSIPIPPFGSLLCPLGLHTSMHAGCIQDAHRTICQLSRISVYLITLQESCLAFIFVLHQVGSLS